MTGEFRLGKIVNKIVPLSATPTQTREMWAKTNLSPSDIESLPREGPPVTPRAFLATVEGSIYMLGTINPPYLHILLTLQNLLANRVQGAGGMPWAKYRAWRTEVVEKDEPFRVVDGEMMEGVLVGMSDEDVGLVLREGGLDKEGVSVRDVRRWGEELRRLC